MDGRRGEGRGFSEVWISNRKYALHCQFAPPCQISCRSVKPFGRYGRLMNFSRWRPSAILDFQKFVILTAYTIWRAKLRHHAKFCADRSNRCGDMAVFDLRWRPSAILDFQKLEIITACALRRAKMRHRAEFCADRSNRCGDMEVYNFSRWRPSAILDFQTLKSLTAQTLWRAKMCHRTKFRADRSNGCGVS